MVKCVYVSQKSDPPIGVGGGVGGGGGGGGGCDGGDDVDDDDDDQVPLMQALLQFQHQVPRKLQLSKQSQPSFSLPRKIWIKSWSM